MSTDHMQPDSNKSVNIGNASSPSPMPENWHPSSQNQILSKRAEKYLREQANVEDYPDAKDNAEMDKKNEEDQ